MVTYNHEKYISKAIESVLMQVTTFPIKLIIGEDCSTDMTAAICAKFKGDNPQKIETIFNSENLGAINNAKIVYEACIASGAKYIAMLEGDDYWTDPFKLQKQVDFLETHSGYSFSCHLVKISNEETKEFSQFGKDYIIGNENREITINDFLNPFLIITCSLVFRRSCFVIEKKKMAQFKDISLFAELLSKGSGILLNECMAVYRQHSGGVWSSTSNLMKCKANAYTLMEINKHFKYKISHIKSNASIQISDYLNLLIAEKERNFHEKIKIFIILLMHYSLDIGIKQLLKHLKRILKSTFCFKLPKR
jgi:glycosyltransferase involved in cell wall biosynthesis